MEVMIRLCISSNQYRRGRCYGRIRIRRRGGGGVYGAVDEDSHLSSIVTGGDMRPLIERKHVVVLMTALFCSFRRRNKLEGTSCRLC